MINTPLDWARALLPALGAPVTSDNDAVLVAWAEVEGGHFHNSAKFNPLNTTHRMPGSVSMNSANVQRYTSWASGLSATTATLFQSNMTGIVRALRANEPAPRTAQAIGDSSWLDAHPPHPAYVHAILSRLTNHPTPTPPGGPTMGRYQMTSTPSGKGYWIIDTTNGAVYTFGDAAFHGGINTLPK